jgi:GNAT superfamily N-acetyltransferase
VKRALCDGSEGQTSVPASASRDASAHDESSSKSVIIQTVSHATVRPARLGDEQAIAEVHVRTWQAAYRGQVPDEFLDELPIAPRIALWRSVIVDLQPPVSQAFVLEEDQRVVGFAHVIPSRDKDAGDDVGELTAIYVDPKRWRAGGGRLLLDHAMAGLSTAGFSVATLWVLRTNEGPRRFYETLGWALDGATKDEQREDFTLHEVRYRRSTADAVQPPR